MNDWWFIAGFIVLVLLALMIALHPLRKQKAMMSMLAPVFIIIVTFAYWRWGAWSDWQIYLDQQSKKEQVQAMLKAVNGPQALIDKLKARLSNNPESARGWFLLGRLYASQDDWSQARDAFAKANELQPDEQAAVNYAQSLWQLNQRQFDKTIRGLFNGVLQKNPNQPDALAMLAMDSFMSHDYQQAIDYWQRLLKLAPPGSEDADAIRKAIAKAQQQLG